MGSAEVIKQTTTVRQGHEIDATSLERYLAEHLEGYRGPLEVRQFEGGQSNPTYLLHASSGDYVLRKKPPGQLLPSAHAVDREYRVMTALAETDVPVPVTLLMCNDIAVIGTPFFVMDCVAGRVFRQPHLPGVSPSDRARMYEQMAVVLANLHHVEAGSIGLGDYGRPGNYYARQTARWSQQYVSARTDEIVAMNRLMEWLPANIPPGNDAAIVHGDYRVENLIFHSTKPLIVAVVDWELSTLGHPLADLAYNCLTYHLPPEALGRVEVVAEDRSGMPDEATYVATYCRLTGRDSIANWNFYLAFSMFRLASILQGVYARGLQGNAASSYALQRGAAARLIAEKAWAIAGRAAG
jgi:aminoglycoside phosphotransferase (APT) family kinase protein